MSETSKQNGVTPGEESKKGATSQAFEGIYFPPVIPGNQPWPERIRNLRQLTMRDDDVMLLTYPKTGTHWLWETISMLRRGSAEQDKISKVQLMMEFVQNDVLDQQASPRTFNTHLPFSMLPVPEIKARRLKIVHVFRNPKDTCVSMYHMAKSSQRMSSVMPTEKFEDFFEHYFFGSKQIFGSYTDYLKQIHAFQQQNPDMPMFNLSYEDVKKDPVGSVKQLASFLGVAVSDDLCVQIAEECSFDKMKARAAEKEKPILKSEPLDEEGAKSMTKHAPVIYRKGQIGDWKNHFTVAMSERVDRFLEDELKDLPFKFTFE